jgi:hypothetical protein
MSSEDFSCHFDFDFDNWSGGDNQQLLQVITESNISPGTDHPHATSHTPTTNESTICRSSLSAPKHSNAMTEDHIVEFLTDLHDDTINSIPIESNICPPGRLHHDLVISKSPINFATHTPANVAADFSRRLPYMGHLPDHCIIMNDQPASKKLKIKPKLSRQVMRCNSETSKTRKQNGSLLDLIGMNKVELEFH